MTAVPQLAGIVVHWHAEDALAELFDAWPHGDARFELVVVDNGSDEGLKALVSRHAGASRLSVLRPASNLGFAGGVNLGMSATQAPILLLLNADARPEPEALDALLDGFDRLPVVAGLAPRLLGADGAAQFRWQLRSLPSAPTLVLQTLMVPAGQGQRVEPAGGAAVEQPAAAVLAIRRSALEALGGMDESFWPAWFEDVDLARRARDLGLGFVYWPKSVFVHHLGSSLPTLGYGAFLSIYYRNLVRYLAKHHGRFAATVARVLLPPAALLRLAVLPVRRPRRARSRRQAAAGLGGLAVAAARGWRGTPDAATVDER